MTFLTPLGVVNDMLATMGEAPLNEPDDGHPLYPQAARMLNTASYRLQARGWWFNTEITELVPDTGDGNIYLPDGTIRVDPRDTGLNYVQRGRRLYSPFKSTGNKYVFDSKVRCWLVRFVAFDELPAAAQLAVSYSAQVDFQRAYDADPAKYQELVREQRVALLDLNAEHTRNVNANLLVPAMREITQPRAYAPLLGYHR